MAAFQFATDELARMLANKEIDLDTDDLRVILVMTNTTVDTEKDKTTVAGYTTLDQCDGANHPATGKALASKTLNAGTNLTFADCADIDVGSGSGIGVGTRQMQGALLVKFVTNIAASIPLAYYNFATPIWGNGSTITLTINAGGFLEVKAITN